jgi:hypothetical protein
MNVLNIITTTKLSSFLKLTSYFQIINVNFFGTINPVNTTKNLLFPFTLEADIYYQPIAGSGF